MADEHGAGVRGKGERRDQHPFHPGSARDDSHVGAPIQADRRKDYSVDKERVSSEPGVLGSRLTGKVFQVSEDHDYKSIASVFYLPLIRFTD